MTSGGASRIAVGVTALTMKPASRAAAMTAADGMPSSSIARSSPRPRVPATPVDRDVVEQRADLADVVEQAVALDRVEHGETGRAGERVAAERACRAGRP